jgi:hypothetical protein
MRPILSGFILIVATALALPVRARAVGAQAGTMPDAPPAIQTLVRQAIEDRLKAADIPDLDLRFGRNRGLHIRREISHSGRLLTEEALPRVAGFTFSILTKAELQAESDRLNQSAMFIIVNAASIQGDTAAVELGTDILMPTTSRALKQCCCIAVGTFNHRDVGWAFDHWSGLVCS